MLLVASKKSLTMKWLKEAPSTDEWVDVVHRIFVMEIITFNLRTQKEAFPVNWQKWTT